jgi:hypothetical protein
MKQPNPPGQRLAQLRHAMRPSLRRHHAQSVRAVMTVYVRDDHGHTATIELAPDNTVWWATECALISLRDERRAEECRLIFRARPLNPRRSLAAHGVGHGDTLTLVPATAIRRRRTIAGTLAPRSLRHALATKRPVGDDQHRR